MLKTFLTTLFIFFASCLSSKDFFAPGTILNTDGTLNTWMGLSGSVDISRYHIDLDPCKGPVLSPLVLTPAWNNPFNGPGNIVNRLLLIGTDIYVAGTFLDAGGNTACDRIARWDGSTWQALGTGLSDWVYEMVLHNGIIYVGGDFVNAGGDVNADRLAKWDGTSWSAVAGGLNDFVEGIAFSGSDIYVGGGFLNAGGNANADNIAYWNGSGWQALGTGLGNWVRDIQIDGSNVYVGGLFQNAGGNANADRIARWDGSTWNAMGAGAASGEVDVILVDGANVYIGGNFSSTSGVPGTAYIARWDGSSWNPLGPGLNSAVLEIYKSGTDLYMGGGFSDAGGIADADRIAIWNGSSWAAVGAGLASSGSVYCIDINNAGVPYIGGIFTNAGGNPAVDYLAYWAEPLPVTLTHFDARLNDSHEVVVSWETASEKDCNFYEVQHQSPGSDYAVLEKVDCQAENGHGNYSFTHTDPAPQNYYRLKQTDTDGQFTYSRVVGVDLPADMVLNIFPNPVREDLITIDLSKINAEEVAIEIRDNNGKVILAVQLSNEANHLHPLALKNLLPGTYVVTVLADNFTVQCPLIKI